MKNLIRTQLEQDTMHKKENIMNHHYIKSSQNLEENIDFKDLLFTFFENKFLILFTMLSIVSLALMFTFFRSAQYAADSLIKIEKSNQSNMNALFQTLNLDSQLDSDNVESQIAILRSRVILEPVVKQLNLDISVSLHHYFDFISRFLSSNSQDYFVFHSLQIPPEYFEKVLHIKLLDSTHFALFDQDKTELLKGEIGKKASKNGFDIQFDLTEQTKSNFLDHPQGFDVIKHSMTDSISKLLPKLQIEELSGGKNKPTGILKINLKSTHPKRVVEILNAIVNAAEQEDGIRKSLELSKTIEFLTDQIPIVKSALEEAESTLNHYREITGKLDIKVEMQQMIQTIANIDKQIVEIDLTKADLLQKYTEQHPLILNMNDKSHQLQKLKKDFSKEMRKLPASDQQAINLMRDVEVKNSVYLIVLNRLQELKILRAGTLSNIRILAYAKIPDMPISRQGAIIGLASVIFGLVIGCIFVLIKRSIKNTITDSEWIEQNLNLENLAIIPYSKIQANYENNAFGSSKLNKIIPILAEKNPFDVSVESLRGLRTNLDLRFQNIEHKIITITGPDASIGKSFISSNLAFLFAQNGKKVLLIDADLRKGKLDRYFGKCKFGLADYLSHKSTFEQSVQKTIYQTLEFLPSGTYPDNPSELLMSSQFTQIIKNLSPQYDFIIIDAPPILPVTDALVISRVSNINLFVLGSDMHTSSDIKLALNKFRNASIKIHGSIFNYSSHQMMKYGNSYQRYYRYSYAK